MEITHLQELKDIVNRINSGTPDAYPFKNIDLVYINRSPNILSYNVVRKTIFLYIDGFTQEIFDAINKKPQTYLIYFAEYLMKKHKINLPDWEIKYFNYKLYDGVFHLKNITY